MKSKKIWLVRPVFIMLVASNIFLALLSFFFDKRLFVVELIVTGTFSVIAFIRLRHVQKDIYRFLKSMGDHLNLAEREALYNFPMPVIVVSEAEEIVWYNDLFRDGLLKGEDDFGMKFDVISQTGIQDFCNPKGIEITYNGKHYRVFGISPNEQHATLYMLYFIDITNLKKRSEEYSLSRPSVMIIMIDNYDELMQNAKESEKSRLLGEIDSVLEDLMSKTSGVIKKLRYDRFFAVVEERHLKDMISGRFEFLQKAREILTNDGIAVTLSVGVGRESRSLSESESSALQALDMALGRGGDQVAIKTENGYDFYGGVSKGFEKRTKVKSRIVATALLELIEASEDVIVMGHKFSDLDCLGASIGLAQAVRAMGKNSSIAVDSEKSLATILIDHLNEQDVTGLFVHPDIALSNVTKNTLLIIVDTHNPQFVESFELYKACETVVVIDHHRKMVNFIGDAVIFYHEPYASSASEMVTEIIQYFGGKNTIGRAEAESLLSGIMLDTRNFAIRTGVRTFEAAAYLRRMGADTVAVRKLFSNSIDTYQRRSRLVSTAEIYKRCAISMCDFMSDDIRIVAPQAADDLLTIFGVDASFVIFEDGDEVKVSARSMGTINVQLIAEALGGGGHQTMAGVQMKNSNIEKARQMLLETIDQYYENNKPVKKE